MWGGLEKILEHVTSYSTNAGKVWYLIVFVFRLIIVATVGQSVYSDEQSAFRCSTKVIGCDNVCYDKFSKISHIRYWSFQLLAVTAPAVVFHFYSLNVRGHVAKLKSADREREDNRNADTLAHNANATTDDEMKRARAARMRKKLLRKQQSVGKFKEKEVYKHSNVETVTWTRSIRAAYLINVALRIVIEVISLYVAYTLFHFVDYTATESYNPLSVILIKVPQVYLCEGENVEWACGQHLSLGKTPGYVPCWVSRPWEKTIFMCYMNILSAFCCVLSCIEFAQLAHRYITNRFKRKTDRSKARRTLSTRSTTFHSVNEEVDGRRPRHTTITLDDHPTRYLYRTPAKPSRKSSRSSRYSDRYARDGGVAVPYKVIGISEHSMRGQSARKPKFKISQKQPVGITLQDYDSDEFSQPSYHSSEYESSSGDEGEDSRKSVSVRSEPDV